MLKGFVKPCALIVGNKEQNAVINVRTPGLLERLTEYQPDDPSLCTNERFSNVAN